MTTPQTTTPKLTAADRVLLAADGLAREGRAAPGLPELVVAAWRAGPEAFGLRGYAGQHPDSNRVACELCGRRGLVGRGLLRRLPGGGYELTHAGRERAARLRGEPAPPLAPERLRLAREDDAILGRLLGGAAWGRWQAGDTASLRFPDALAFWGEAGSEAAGAALGRLAAALDGRTAVLRSGREVTAGELRGLLHLHGWLAERFAAHLGVLGARGRGRAAQAGGVC